MRKILVIAIAIILLIIVGLLFIRTNKEVNFQNSKMQISSVFENEDEVPVKYTADGDDVNPPLEITEIPQGAKSLVLIMDDPDAPMGTWVHWIVFNIPMNGDKFKIGEDSIPSGAVQGVNSWGKNNYGGPNPPPGKPHRYFFKVYALNDKLNLPENSKKSDVEKAMKGHILDKAELFGFYGKEMFI